VAPSIIVYKFLKLSYVQHSGGLDVSFFWLTPAFVIAAAGAYRLGKFNLDTTQSFNFKGMPTPAVGLLIASFPLIFWYSGNTTIVGIFLNKWFWYAFILVISYLMVSNLPIMSLKFKDFSLKNNIPKIILLIVSIVLALLLKWLAVPVIFLIYIAVSLAFKKRFS
ncbi:MAG TPA: CDP-alcohol phosphatidyltransferase, partial [Chitinophagaceae bacterium]|nr:CDP-alcohol phosphatidyltransferase [Chitinophagaceae bacterium]